MQPQTGVLGPDGLVDAHPEVGDLRLQIVAKREKVVGLHLVEIREIHRRELAGLLEKLRVLLVQIGDDDPGVVALALDLADGDLFASHRDVRLRDRLLKGSIERVGGGHEAADLRAGLLGQGSPGERVDADADRVRRLGLGRALEHEVHELGDVPHGEDREGVRVHGNAAESDLSSVGETVADVRDRRLNRAVTRTLRPGHGREDEHFGVSMARG